MFNIFLFIIITNKLITGLSVMRCTKNDNNIVLNLTSGQVKGYCRFIDNNANQFSEHLHAGNVYTFLSVPYAEPPIKNLRFKKTVQKSQWPNEILDATKWPKTCIQEQDRNDELFAGFKMWNTNQRTTSLSEDCLYLNIWLPLDAYIDSTSTSNLERNKQPILVFFHGGSTTTKGSSSLDIYDPSTFVASKSIIVITVNYRLGVFGSLYSEELDLPGNQGIYDQLEALKWINLNADRFGGDSERITIAGHESGASLVAYHLFMKRSWDLFNNLILQSGTPLLKSLAPISKQEGNRRALQVLELAGCGDKNENQLDCIQNSEAVFNASLDAFRQSIEGNLITELYLKTYYPLVIDNDLIDGTPDDLLKKGLFKQCPILTGFTANEGSFTIARSGLLGFKISELKKQQNLTHADLFNFLSEYFAYYPNYSKSLNKMVLDLILHEYTKLTNVKDEVNLPSSLMKSSYFNDLSKIIADQACVCPIYKFSDALAKHGSHVYLYLYSHRVSSSPWPIWYGAVTGDELAFTFGHTIANNKQKTTISYNPWASSRHLYTNNEKILTKEIINYWSSFIKFNNPNSEGGETVKWPHYTLYNRDDDTIPFSQSGQYMVFKINGTKVSRGYSLEQCKFWNSYLPNLMNEYDETIKEKVASLNQPAKCSVNTESIKQQTADSDIELENQELKNKNQAIELNSDGNSFAEESTKQVHISENHVEQLFNSVSSSFVYVKNNFIFAFLISIFFYFNYMFE